jgi:hypothetical protein
MATDHGSFNIAVWESALIKNGKPWSVPNSPPLTRAADSDRTEKREIGCGLMATDHGSFSYRILGRLDATNG